MTIKSSAFLPLTIALMVSVYAASAPAAEIVPSSIEPSNDRTPILTLTHRTERQQLSLREIESLGLYGTELRHYEGPEGRFTGVRLEQLITRYGLDDARRLRFIAADDYTVFLTPKEIRAKDYLLVTRFEGEPIPRRSFGPLMLVVPADERAVLGGAPSRTNWIWALTEIRAQ